MTGIRTYVFAYLVFLLTCITYFLKQNFYNAVVTIILNLYVSFLYVYLYAKQKQPEAVKKGHGQAK